MMFLVGLMGVMAVGATALYGFESSGSSDESDDDFANGGGERDDMADGGPDAMDGVGDLHFAEEPASTAPDTQSHIDWGDDADNTVDGTAGSDQLNGYDGDDLVLGRDGGDYLHGGAGDDSVEGGAGNDQLHGEEGDDLLNGDDGADSLFGHDGDDLLFGDAGDDSVVGSAGNDDLDGGAGSDALHGDLGDDTLDGGAGADSLHGGWGNDVIIGLPEDGAETETDYLNGGGGDDLIVTGANDIVTAGEGADTIALGDWLNQDHQAEILDFESGQDNLMIVYEDQAGAAPDVSLEPDDTDPDRQHVVMNGVRIASVADAPDLTLDDLVLIGQSALDNLTAA